MLSAVTGDDKRRSRQARKMRAASTTAQRAAAVRNTETPSDRRPAERRRVSARSEGLSGSFAVGARTSPPSTPASTFTSKEAARMSRAGLSGCTALTGLPPLFLNAGYNKSNSSTCSLVGCRNGNPGDQLHSDTIVATPLSSAELHKNDASFVLLDLAPSGADERWRAAPNALAALYCHKSVQHRKFLFPMLYNNQAPRETYK
jgi:hypothetical protein